VESYTQRLTDRPWHVDVQTDPDDYAAFVVLRVRLRGDLTVEGDLWLAKDEALGFSEALAAAADQVGKRIER
jgi:hypothetical protein